MGTERLTLRWPALAVTLLLLGACGRAVPPSSPGPSPAEGAHTQIFRAMKTPERHALVARFRERNPTDAKTIWKVNEDALDDSVVVVDPFKGFLRRAHRERPRAAAAVPITSEEAVGRARAFVRRNAELLGLVPSTALALGEELKTAPAPSPRSSWGREIWLVHFDARFPSRGYEGFPEVQNTVDIDVAVDDDGEVSAFDNRSILHPRLSLSLHPALAPGDPRVVAKLVGRRVFAVVDDERHSSAREFQRVPLGEVHADDVARVQLIIHTSPGPRLAWLTYRLAYIVDISKTDEPHGAVPVDSSYSAYNLRYVVDADTGDVVEDARPPIAVSP